MSSAPQQETPRTQHRGVSPFPWVLFAVSNVVSWGVVVVIAIVTLSPWPPLLVAVVAGNVFYWSGLARDLQLMAVRFHKLWRVERALVSRLRWQMDPLRLLDPDATGELPKVDE